MSSILVFLTSLPELMKLIRAIGRQIDLQQDDGKRDRKEVKKNIEKIAKAIEENDEKALNDVFNSL